MDCKYRRDKLCAARNYLSIWLECANTYNLMNMRGQPVPEILVAVVTLALQRGFPAEIASADKTCQRLNWEDLCWAVISVKWP
jgi:hypothetical protein